MFVFRILMVVLLLLVSSVVASPALAGDSSWASHPIQSVP